MGSLNCKALKIKAKESRWCPVHACMAYIHLYLDGKVFRVVEPNCFSTLERRREMSDCAVDIQVLCTVPVMFSYWAKPKDTLEISRMLNDDLAETIASNPKNYIGLGTIPMNDPSLAVLELERCINEVCP